MIGFKCLNQYLNEYEKINQNIIIETHEATKWHTNLNVRSIKQDALPYLKVA